MTQTRRVTGVMTDIRTNNGTTHISYRGTDVVSFNAQEITLRTGGWKTATTKTRMNQTANQFELGFQVYQDKGEWFVNFNGEKIEFTGNTLILSRVPVTA